MAILSLAKGCGKLFDLSVEDFLVCHEVNGNFAIGSRMNEEFYIAFSDSFYSNSHFVSHKEVVVCLETDFARTPALHNFPISLCVFHLRTSH